MKFVEFSFLSDLRPGRVAASLLLLLSVTLSASHAQEAGGEPRENRAKYRAALAAAVRQAAQAVLPSTVSIEVIGVSESGGGNNQSEVAQDAPTCGVVLDAQGYIIAADIIVRRPSASILVVLPDETRLAARVVARDHHRGLVMLKVDPDSPLQPVELPDQIQTPVGSTVVTVGRLGGDLSPIVSTGILSAVDRLEGTMLQTDARVSPSFYGGPLVDLHGNVIGISVPAVAPGGAPDETSWYDSGIAFAVPTPVLAAKLARLKEGNDIKKGLIGIVPKSQDPLAEGTELAAVRSRSPAEQAGIKPGDTIEAIAGKPVRMFQEIKQALGPFDAGETIQIRLARDGASQDVQVTLADSIPPLQPQRLGVWVADGESDDQDGPGGVMVRGVVPATAADGVLQADDRILQVGQTTIEDVSTLRRLMITAVPDQALTVKLSRQGKTQDVQITPQSIAGDALQETLPDWEPEDPEAEWKVQSLRLPDVANLASYVAPSAEDVSDNDAIGLLVLLLPPDQRDPAETLKSWTAVAGRHGVVVCAICSEDEKRWQPTEIDIVSRMVTMLSQRLPIGGPATAIAAPGAIKGVDASAADSMVIAIALSDRGNFSGIAVSAETRPPAVRLRENEPDRSLEILMPIKSLDDGPTWLAPLVGAGYPVALGGDNELSDLLRWTRLLQTI
ncbi:PDZ domain-containing protein [Roseiconus nitratireducens]|uniref:PDZ domain-containing protein n=1 Tax=Roseiconus nitratireducens TaxID=2605748 RepID=A0A5M6D1Q8_9BACT|nr:trypsin-like peptidase domain-containing protein [Roseiconus nitratireducens]KAA5540232.1 PDZ domain-containing protein [Roseiconus nitratireducens]